MHLEIKTNTFRERLSSTNTREQDPLMNLDRHALTNMTKETQKHTNILIVGPEKKKNDEWSNMWQEKFIIFTN